MLQFELIWDIRNFVVGAAFRQRRDEKPFVIYYGSKILDETQMNY